MKKVDLIKYIVNITPSFYPLTSFGRRNFEKLELEKYDFEKQRIIYTFLLEDIWLITKDKQDIAAMHMIIELEEYLRFYSNIQKNIPFETRRHKGDPHGLNLEQTIENIVEAKLFDLELTKKLQKLNKIHRSIFIHKNARTMINNSNEHTELMPEVNIYKSGGFYGLNLSRAELDRYCSEIINICVECYSTMYSKDLKVEDFDEIIYRHLKQELRWGRGDTFTRIRYFLLRVKLHIRNRGI